MKILIVDDALPRNSLFMEKAKLLGLRENDIHFCSCVKDAREKLAKEYYDLLVLDLLVPYECYEIADNSRHTISLLMALQHGSDLKKPGHIIGITSDKDEAIKSASRFETYTWMLIEYSPINLSWMTTLLNYIRYLLETSSTPNVSSKDSVDVVIVCALKSPEFEALMQLPWHWEEFMPISEVIFIRRGFFYSNGQKITVAAAHVTRMGMVSTAITASYLISYFQPKIITMCGICAGVKGKVNIGDIVFADPVWDYQSGKFIKEDGVAKFSISPHQLGPSQMLRSFADVLSSDKELLLNLEENIDELNNRDVMLKIGPMASGSAVLADSEILEAIKSQHRDLAAVEMETYGLFSAASFSSRPQPLYFSMKSVCDFADSDKNDNFQFLAARTSARCLGFFLEKFGNKILGAHNA